MRCSALSTLRQLLLGAGLVLLAAAIADAQITRVSIASGGTQGNGDSRLARVSADGRFVVFGSHATNLVTPNDLLTVGDIFLHDRETGRTSRVSVNSDGGEANDNSGSADISANGRFIAFTAAASNLVANDNNGRIDVFLRDTLADHTTLLTRGFDGSGANNDSRGPAISGDGRFVVFDSPANNLVENDSNNRADVFIVDTNTGSIHLVSVSSHGARANGSSFGAAISADGRYVGFSSVATNLVDGDTNNRQDVFLHDRQTGETTRVSVGIDFTQTTDDSYMQSISGGGRYVVFSSTSPNLLPRANSFSGVFVLDRELREITRVDVADNGSPADRASAFASISDDGLLVAFDSKVFVHDRGTRRTTIVSRTVDGRYTHGISNGTISGDGRVVVFHSAAPNLVLGDSNSSEDAFVSVPPTPGTGPPGAPSNFAATVTGTVVSFTWTTPTSGGAVQSYVIAAGLTPGATDATVPTGSTATSFLVGAPAGRYYVRVRGLNSAGVGPPSNEILVVVGNVCAVAPDAPSGLAATVTGVMVSLSWAAATGCPADAYILEVGTAPGLTDLMSVPIGNVTAFSAPAVPGRFYLRVRARNAYGISSPSNEVVVIVGSGCTVAPDAPSGLTGSVSGRQVTVSWNAAGGCPADSYVLEVGSTSGATDIFVGDVGNITTLSQVAPPGTYFVRVRARNAFGVSGTSNGVIVAVP
jgi:hypothetical protein